MKEIFYDWGGANVWLFHAINDIRFEWLDKLMLLGTYLGGHQLFPFYLVLLTVVALLLAHKPVQDAAHFQARVKCWMLVLAVFSLSYWLNGILLGYLKPLLDYPRPPLALSLDAAHIIGTAEFHHSLPSGHSAFAMMVLASLWPLLKRGWRLAGVVFVLWVGISRVSLGMHFPADVMAGFLLSLLLVLLVRLALLKLTGLVFLRSEHKT